MKPTTLLTLVLKQINEQFENDLIYVKVYGKKMLVDFYDGHAYIYIDPSLSNERYSKLIKVNLLLKRYFF